MKCKYNCHRIGVSILKISIFLQQKVISNISAPDYASKFPIFATFSLIFSQQYEVRFTIYNILKTATNEGYLWILVKKLRETFGMVEIEHAHIYIYIYIYI